MTTSNRFVFTTRYLNRSKMGLVKTILKMLIATVTSITAISAILLYRYQLSLIYPSFLNDARKKTDKPSSFNLPFEEVYIPTKDGIKLHTFILRQDHKSADYKNKTVLVLCPNAGNIGNSLPIVEILYRSFGYNVVIYSYRGYGQSTGIAEEKGLKIDADTVLQYISVDPILSASSVVLYGRSLGGACAIYIASKNYTFVKGVILENTFLSLRKCIPHIFPFLSKFTFLCHQFWESEKDILQVDPSVEWLFLNGDQDEIVPPDHMRQLFELCTSEKKRRVIFQGGRHNDTVIADGYWDIVQDFIRNVAPVEK